MGSRKDDRPAATLVLGWGRSGQAAATLLAGRGVGVLATDDRAAAPDSLAAGIDWISPTQAPAKLADVDRIVVSPGVPASHPLLQAALTAGIDVVSELELGWQFLVADSQRQGKKPPALLAITGTNGKSTTVTLAAAMLSAAGRRTFAGGNLGAPLCEAVGEEFDALVVEVSSFQLEWVQTFCPDVGILLAVAPDHLDRHGSFENYLATKLRLFERQGAAQHALLSVDAGLADRVGGGLAARVSTFGRQEQAPTPVFAANQAGRVILREGRPFVELPEHWPVAPHDFSNAAAAVAGASLLGAPASACAGGLAEFRPLAHRLGLVGQKNGVDYWNDSKATNVAATRASLLAFAKPVVLLLGGVPKGEDFGLLAEDSAQIRTAVAYGQAAAEIEEALADKLDLVRCADLTEAFAWATENTQAGESVLLAPACASFDAFRNYVERGEAFVRLVEALP